jgi:type VI secretion system FHA domain protein
MDGMQIKIGDYEVVVSIRAEQHQDKFAVDHFSSFFEPDSIGRSEGLLSHSGLASENLLDRFNHADNLLDPFSSGAESSSLLSTDLFSPSVDARENEYSGVLQKNIASIHDSFVPSTLLNAERVNNDIPDDFNFEDLFKLDADAPEPSSMDLDRLGQDINEQARDDNHESRDIDDFFSFGATKNPENSLLSQPTESVLLKSMIPERSSVKPPETQTFAATTTFTDDKFFNAFIEGAGLDNKNIKIENTPEQMRLIGMMFRHLVDGTVGVLRSRAEFKSQFRVSVTTIKSADNNPLKFSVTTDEAVSHLLNNGQGGFKHSVEAIDEGFNDIVTHQLAMQAGIQAALSELFSKFDPKCIEKLFEEGLVLQKKSRCWEKYVALYPGIVEQTTEEFFGEAFADAYEKQMRRLAGSLTKNK